MTHTENAAGFFRRQKKIFMRKKLRRAPSFLIFRKLHLLCHFSSDPSRSTDDYHTSVS